jgi:hypothetical protein
MHLTLVVALRSKRSVKFARATTFDSEARGTRSTERFGRISDSSSFSRRASDTLIPAYFVFQL